jgi:hypothetical protein
MTCLQKLKKREELKESFLTILKAQLKKLKERAVTLNQLNYQLRLPQSKLKSKVKKRSWMKLESMH